jgi:hypothetical protein
MKAAGLLCAVLLPAALAAQERTLLTVVAFGAPGAAGNRWSSELYLSNLSATAMDVTVAGVLPLRVKQGPHPCLPPITPIHVEGQRTRLLLASELATYLGCPEEFVGGLVLEHPPGLLVASRMTNTKSFLEELLARPLQGFSQEIPGVLLADLPSNDGRYMIPSLAWDPNPCDGQARFDVYLYLANPSEEERTVTLWPREGEEMRLRIPDREVLLPLPVKVPAGKLVQLAIKPPLPPGEAPCGQVQFFDLFFEADGSVGVLASVVDRASNDARTILVTKAFRLIRQ